MKSIKEEELLIEHKKSLDINKATPELIEMVEKMASMISKTMRYIHITTH